MQIELETPTTTSPLLPTLFFFALIPSLRQRKNREEWLDLRLRQSIEQWQTQHHNSGGSHLTFSNLAFQLPRFPQSIATILEPPTYERIQFFTLV